MVQAKYLGTSFTAEVPVDIGDIDCDIVIGREWISLLQLVVNNQPATALRSRACSSPSLEGGPCHLPEGGWVIPLPTNELPQHLSDRTVSERLLKEALFGGSLTPSTWHLFGYDTEALHQECVSHGVTVVDQTDPQSSLLRHVFTGSCVLGGVSDPPDCRVACSEVLHGIQSQGEVVTILVHAILQPDRRFPTDRLAKIAQAIGLVASGTKVERRKLVPMLEEYGRGCASMQLLDVDICVTVNKVEGLTRAGLLSVGFAHGLALQGNRDIMCDALVLHLSSGECAVNACKNLPACASIIGMYIVGDVTPDRNNVRMSILDAMSSGRIKSLPLKRLLRILKVPFEVDMTLPKLRKTLGRYVRRVQSEQEHRVTDVAHSDWPVLLSDQQKTDVVNRFRQATSSDTLKTFVCSSCNARRNVSEGNKVPLGDIDTGLLNRPDRRVVDSKIAHLRWIDPLCVGPKVQVLSEPLSDLLVAPEGVVVVDGQPSALMLCGACKSSLLKGKTPDLALANNMYLGDVPPELSGLSVVEEAMIARCRAKSWIVHLQETESTVGCLPNSQRGMCGHIIVYPQEPERAMNILPPSIDDVVTPIYVIFVGSSMPSKEWLRKHARPLIVRKEKVFAVLRWLRAHNPYYKDISINETVFDGLDNEDILPFHVEVIPPSQTRDVLTSRYDGMTQDRPLQDDTAHMRSSHLSTTRDVFDTVVVTNVDPSAPSHVLQAAALEHVMKKGKGYLQVPHGPNPIGNICNPAFFPLTYPTLFPYGLGAPEDSFRSCHVSLKRHVSHLLQLADRRFQTHYSFLFTAFNVLQRRNVLLHSSLKIDQQLFDAFRSDFALVSPAAMHTVAERALKGDQVTCFTGEEKRVRDLLKQVSHVMARVEGSSSARNVMRNEIRGLTMEMGLPAFYVMVNPADVYNPIVKLLTREEIDVDNLLPDQIPDFWTQSVALVRNPVAGSQFFHLYMTAFIQSVLGYNGTTTCSERTSESHHDHVGILGRVNAYYGCVEAQGRGSLHCHMLVWLKDSLDCDEIKHRVLHAGDTEFRNRLLAFLDDTIASSVPADPLPGIDICSSVNHPCSVRGPSLEGSDDTVILKCKKDVHCLATACQVHKHTTTCFKYWKGPPEPRECRFGLDERNFVGRSYIDDETGDVHLRYLDGMVNRYNETMLECLRCNMDIQFVGSGVSAKAIVYYITDYITKSQLKAHVAYSALEVAVAKVGEYDPTVDDLKVCAKRLLQKCVYSMISRQELSAQQVCSYLLAYGDHYTSHVYRNLYWSAFERALERQLPSPECYPVSSEQSRWPERVDTHDDESSADKSETDTGMSVSNGEEEDGDALPDVEPATNEYTVHADQDGNLIACMNQVDNYRFRSWALQHVCLWDFCAQINKIKQRRGADDMIDHGGDSDCLTEAESDAVELTTSRVPALDVLGDTSYRRPCFQFLSNHVESKTRQLRMRHPSKRYVPVPIGPPLPRRDHEVFMARHARAMLLLFKPWRSASDLQEGNDSWTAAYNAWTADPQGTYPSKHCIVDNIHALQECKDARDQDMLQ